MTFLEIPLIKRSNVHKGWASCQFGKGTLIPDIVGSVGHLFFKKNHISGENCLQGYTACYGVFLSVLAAGGVVSRMFGISLPAKGKSINDVTILGR